MNQRGFWAGVLCGIAAIAACRPATAAEFTSAAEAINKGDSLLEKGDYAAAISAFTAAIRLDPKNAVAYSGRGRAYVGKGEPDKAIADCTEAIRLDPKLAKAYYGLGNAYRKKGDFDKAIADYTDAIRLDPKFAAATTLIEALPLGRRGSRRRLPRTSRTRSASSRNTPRRTTIAAACMRCAATLKRPSPTTPRPSGTTRNTPSHTMLGASPTRRRTARPRPKRISPKRRGSATSHRPDGRRQQKGGPNARRFSCVSFPFSSPLPPSSASPPLRVSLLHPWPLPLAACPPIWHDNGSITPLPRRRFMPAFPDIQKIRSRVRNPPIPWPSATTTKTKSSPARR